MNLYENKNKMPKFISNETVTDIKRLSKENYSYRQIKNKLKEENIDVSIMTICNFLKNIGIRRIMKSKNL